ncbi:MAG: tetratricopeptide repeat protein [Thermaerobacter sp.]|nr:tetratricopeptide repeat protein [Thermaerobacter sp.]
MVARRIGTVLVMGTILGVLSGCGSATFLVSNAPSPVSPSAMGNQQAVAMRWQQIQVSLDRAITTEEATVAQDPTWAPAHMQLAQMFWTANHPRTALQEAEAASGLAPTSANYALWVGQMAQAMGSLATAQRYYQRALAINPGTWQAWDGQAQIAMQWHEDTAAETDVQRALLAGGPEGPTFDMFGRLAMQAGQWQTAATYFRDAQSANPGWWQGYYDLAQVDFHWGETARGQSALHSALNADPTQAKVFQLLESYPTAGPGPGQ